MARGRWLTGLLHAHQVFPPDQVAALSFDNVHPARNRLSLLAGRGVLARFRDAVRPGSQSWRWALGWVGAAYIAYRDGGPVPRPATISHRVNQLAASPRLAHLLGVNGFFTDLASCARHTPAPPWAPGGRNGAAATSAATWPTPTATACGPQTAEPWRSGWNTTGPANPPTASSESWTATSPCTRRPG